jgi:hypothetical protein
MVNALRARIHNIVHVYHGAWAQPAQTSVAAPMRTCGASLENGVPDPLLSRSGAGIYSHNHMRRTPVLKTMPAVTRQLACSSSLGTSSSSGARLPAPGRSRRSTTACYEPTCSSTKSAFASSRSCASGCRRREPERIADRNA